jgi:hypothetical protein
MQVLEDQGQHILMIIMSFVKRINQSLIRVIRLNLKDLGVRVEL